MARAEVAAGSELDELLTRVGARPLGADGRAGHRPREPLEAGRGRDHARHRRAWSRRSSGRSTDISGRFELPVGVRRPRPGPRVGAPRPRPHGRPPRRAGRRSRCCRPRARRSLPYLNRLSSLLWTLARWAEGEPLPTRTPRPRRVLTPEVPLPLTIELARTAPADVAARPSASSPARPRARASTGPTWPARASRRRRATCAPLPGDGGTTTYVVGLGPAAEVDADVLRFAAGVAGPRRQAARRRSPSTSSARRPTAPARPPAPRRSPRASCSAATSSPPSSPSRSRPSWRASCIVGGGGKRAEDADRPRPRAGRGGVLGARPRERAGRLAHPDGAGQAGGRGGQAAPASRSRCGTRRRSASRSSAGSSA